MPLFRRKTAERQSKPPASVQTVLSGTALKRTLSGRSNRSDKSLPHSPNTPDSWGDDSDLGLPHSVLNGTPAGEKRPRTLTLSETVLQDALDIPEESLESPMRTSSRLSKTLLEILRDSDALSCFKAFMKSQAAEHIIQFWCDAESFHVSTLMRLRTHSMQSISKSALHRRRNEATKVTHTESNSSMDNITLPDSITGVSPQVSRPGDNNHQNVAEADGVGEESCDTNLATQHKLSSSDGVTKEESIEPSTTQLSPVSDPNQIHTSDQHCTDQVPNSSPVHRPNESSPPCHADSHAESTSPMQTAITSCDKPQTGPHAVGPQGAESLQHTTSQNQSDPAAPPPQPLATKANEPSPQPASILRSPSEASQEDLSAKLKKSIERDAVTIFSTYIAKDAPRPLGVNDSLRSEAISKICKEDGEVDPECFVNCQKFALERMDSEYFQSFRDSEFHCRHQVNVLTSEKVYLPDILFNENALCYFMEYMEQEGGSDLMQMWLAADNFQQQLTSSRDTYDGEQAQNDAMVIYDRYFSLQATNPIGFDDKLRFEIESNICRENGPLPDCFIKAKNIVLKILEKMYFPGYLQSQVYYRYLSDLLSTVEMAEDMPNKPFQKGHRRAESDASSEHSIGSQSTGAESVMSRNTLLAVDTRKQRKIGTIEGDFSMNLDMLNPDDLWKRPGAKAASSPSLTSDLSLGCVNELGQFVSKFEHDSDLEKKKGPVLFKRRKEKEKEEEEMALKIAQMIISDVNTMTKTGESMVGKPDS